MNIFITIVFLCTSFLSLAQTPLEKLANPSTEFTQLPLEAWVRLTCIGPINPRINYQPAQLAEIMRFHVPTAVNAPYPTIKEIQDANHTRFEKLTKICTERRLSMVDLTGYTGNWLDWDTDYAYARIKLSEAFYYNNSCRPLGEACSNNGQCCTGQNNGKQSNQVRCNLSTNTCEQNALLNQQQ